MTEDQQPEQLVEEAQRLATFIRERWNPDNRMPPLGAAETLDALATALSECRERLRKIEARSHPDREQRQSEPQVVLDSIHSHAVAALAAQPPSEASERSGT